MEDQHTSKEALFAVVLFPGKEGADDATSEVPQTWVISENGQNICLWPMNTKNVSHNIETCTPPSDRFKWKKYKVKKLRENIEGYENAELMEKNARDGKDSHLSEISPSPTKQARRAKAVFSPTLSAKKHLRFSPKRKPQDKSQYDKLYFF
ncbi:unnamed protein product [Bemisia tabaci]|uniref:Uncharacterized protein n=1 Tax=Bemisia tabaci TaxID=7038 RepID=A0A9P0AFJ8_BEMTA|nr:unnamed protein product [Bemisia tabaci]